MTVPSISFIIPYYSIEEVLLRRCLDSLLHLSLPDWEVWVVDDGSQERTAELVLNDYDNRYFHYVRKENGGVGSARNLGVSLSTKDYIQFLDADDYLYPSPTKTLIGLLGDLHPEVLSFNFRTEHDGTKRFEPSHRPPGLTYRGSGAQYMATHNIHGTACCSFYRRELLLQTPFSGLAYHEDEEFTPRLLILVRDLIVTDVTAYAYYQRDSSRSHHTMLPQKELRYRNLVDVIAGLHTLAGAQEDGLAHTALERRADMLSLSLLYTLVYESPDARFTHGVLDMLQVTGFYPLRRKDYNKLYGFIRLLTYHRIFILLLNLVLRHFKR